MGGKQSTPTPPPRALSTGGQASSSSADLTRTAGMGSASSAGPSSASTRARARSLGNFPSDRSPTLNIPTSNGGPHRVASQDSDSSNSDDGPLTRPIIQSLPLQLFALQTRLGHLPGIKCPVCSKMVQPEDIECHLVICLTKPRIGYNEDVLTEDKGECVICFEELQQGDTIARLPCLCVYHKSCIDKWFLVNRSCPEHPVD